MAKAKSAPDGWEMEFSLKDISLDGFSSSLAICEVNKEVNKPVGFGGKQETGYTYAAGVKMSNEERDEILSAANDAWNLGVPWSIASQTKFSARYAPMLITKALKKRIKNDAHALALISSFVEMGLWSVEEKDSHSRIKGLQVLKLYQNGTDILRKSCVSSDGDLRKNIEENQ